MVSRSTDRAGLRLAVPLDGCFQRSTTAAFDAHMQLATAPRLTAVAVPLATAVRGSRCRLCVNIVHNSIRHRVHRRCDTNVISFNATPTRRQEKMVALVTSLSQTEKKSRALARSLSGSRLVQDAAVSLYISVAQRRCHRERRRSVATSRCLEQNHSLVTVALAAAPLARAVRFFFADGARRGAPPALFNAQRST
jgi:hypothetical protein